MEPGSVFSHRRLTPLLGTRFPAETLTFCAVIPRVSGITR